MPDRDDLCPDLKGKSMYLGCPEEQKEEKADVAATSTKSADPEPSVTPVDPVETSSYEETAYNSVDDAPAGSPAGDPSYPRVDDGIAPASSLNPSDLAFLERAMQNIYFESGSEQLTWESKAILDTVATLLNQNSGFDLQVLGHTDNTSSQNSNIILSIKRAFNVKYYLVYEKGIKMSRISSDGYSSVAPISDNASEAGRRQNRRVEFKLTPSSRPATSYNY